MILLVLAGVLAGGALVEAVAAGKDRGNADKRLDLNSASESELTRLPGIGPAIAKRIVEFRQKHGPFKRVEDVLKVRGIGEKSFQKIRDRLTVGKQG